jgi:hypothetical protein
MKLSGAQKLNLSLGQLKIDAGELANFINEISKAEQESKKGVINKYFLSKDNS